MTSEQGSGMTTVDLDTTVSDCNLDGNGNTQEWLYGGLGILLGALVTLLVVAIVYYWCTQRKRHYKEKLVDVENRNEYRESSLEDRRSFSEKSSTIDVHEMAETENGSAHSSDKLHRETSKSADVFYEYNSLGEHGRNNAGYQKQEDDAEGGDRKYSMSDISRDENLDAVDNELNDENDSSADAGKTSDVESDVFPDPPDEIFEDMEKELVNHNEMVNVTSPTDILSEEASAMEFDKVISTDTSHDSVYPMYVGSTSISQVDTTTEEEAHSGLSETAKQMVELLNTAISNGADEETGGAPNDTTSFTTEDHSPESDPDEVSISDDDNESDNDIYERDDTSSEQENGAAESSMTDTSISLERLSTHSKISVIDLTDDHTS